MENQDSKTARKLRKGDRLWEGAYVYQVHDVWHIYMIHTEEAETIGDTVHTVRVVMLTNTLRKVTRDYPPEKTLLLAAASPTL